MEFKYSELQLPAHIISENAKRVVSIDSPSKDDLSILRTADFVVPEEKQNS